MKKNNKGFMLTELMVVSVAILVLFIAVYSNFYPNIGEYENRLYYNNIDTEYALFYTRVMYLKYLKANTTTKNNLLTNVSNNNYVTLIENGSCNSSYFSNEFLNKCNINAKKFNIKTLILTSYNPEKIKKSAFTDGKLAKYISYIPNYNSDDELYRLIIKTDYGYANSNFYSKKCNKYIYGNWNYTFKPCNVEEGMCERVNQLYINIGTWTSEKVCEVNEGNLNLCETETVLYRTKTNDTWSEYTEIPCDVSDSDTCEQVTGTFYRKNSFTSNPETVCMSTNDNRCEGRSNGYKYRTKTENTKDTSNFSVDCEA